MNRKKNFIAMICIVAVSFYASCSKSYLEVIKGTENKFYEGRFLDAAKSLKPLASKKDKDQLLYMMEAGYIFHVAKEYQTSNGILLEAAKIAKVKPVSITQQVGALLTNLSNTNYLGEDFEKVLIRMYAGINFLIMGQYDSSRVEFTAVNEELAKIKQENGSARYKQNIMAKYLTAIAYEVSADLDKDMNDLEFAYIEYKQINSLAPQLSIVQDDLIRVSKKLNYTDDYANWTASFKRNPVVSADSGELIVIYESGRGAIKVSRGKLLSDNTMKTAVVAALATMPLQAGVSASAVMVAIGNIENPIPKFEKRSNMTHHLAVTNGKITYSTAMLEDIENTAVNNLKDDYGRLQKHVAAQVVVKTAASIAAGYAAKKAAEQMGAGQYAGLIGVVAGAGTGAALFSQMKPDLRCWHTLPANLQMARLFLPPGKYNITLNFIDSSNNTQNTRSYPVEIKKGTRTFINERTLM